MRVLFTVYKTETCADCDITGLVLIIIKRDDCDDGNDDDADNLGVFVVGNDEMGCCWW
jgi:hypothetical protein